MKSQVNFLVLIFLISSVYLTDLFTGGMFMDGLIYSNIARNIASGQCTFWHLYTTPTYQNPFIEHPPLAIFMESVFYKILGDGLWVERFYSLVISILTAVFVILIWKEIYKRDYNFRNLYVLPLLCLATIPIYFWSVKNNMLENTLTLFTTGAVYFLVVFTRNNKSYLFLVLAEVCILSAFLSKGLVGLFPLVFILIYGIVFKEYKKAFIATVIVFAVFFIGLLLLFSYPDASIYLKKYFSFQVITAIQGKEDPVSRLFFLKRLFQETTVLLVFTLVILFYNFKKKIKHDKWFYVFIGVALSGSLPMLISQKQSGYYLVPSFVFYAMAIAILIAPAVLRISESILQNILIKRVLTGLIIVISVGFLCFNVYQFNKISRDKKLLNDVELISKIVPHGTTIGSTQTLYDCWTTQLYFYRYYTISVERKPTDSFYMLARIDENISQLNYSRIQLNTSMYSLWKQMKPKVK